MYRFVGKLKKRLILACLSTSLLVSSLAFAALPEIISLEDIHAGMQGTGYTVIDSTGEIKPFAVEVVGILGDNSKGSNKRILVNLSGDLIKETGGALSGMSGSPIYFNGKLAGALSAGYTNMYPTDRIMLTPIEDMLKLWDFPDTLNKGHLPQLDLKKLKAEREKFAAEQAKKEAEANQENATDEEDVTEQGENLQSVGAADADEAAANDELTEDEAAEVVSDEDDGVIADDEITSEPDPAEEATKSETDEEHDPYFQIDPEFSVDPDMMVMPENAFTGMPADPEDNADAAYKTREEVAAEAEADAQADGNDDQAGTDGNAPSADAPATEEKSVFFASGFGPAGMEYLQDGMKKLGIKMDFANTYDNGVSTMQTNPHAHLEGGSPVGVAVAVGDFLLGSLGTVTAVDDNKILAFGHSYTHRGNVNYFMTDADVITTIHGPTSGMKLGNVGNIIGRINQDRNDGVAGVLGELPQTVPVIVTVHDKDTGKDITYSSMVAYDEEVFSVLAPTIVYAAIGTTLDRQDASTASLKFSLRSNYGKNGLIERRNMFYDDEDVAKSAISELNDVLGVILGNKEREPDLYDLKVDVTIDRGRKTATLISAKPVKTDVLPGERAEIEVTVQPYRSKEKIIVNVPFTVPENQAPGPLALDVHGGGLVNVTKVLMAQQEALEAGVDMDKEVPVAAQLQEMLKANRNNEIIIESTVVVPKTDAELKKSVQQAKKQAQKAAKNSKPQGKYVKKDMPENKSSTDYIIENIIHTSLTVLEDKEK